MIEYRVYSNVNGQWHTLSQTTPSTITVYSDHLNTTMLYDTCNGLGECDLCGYCYHNASASVLLPNQCLGSNQTPYTPSLSDCTGDQVSINRKIYSRLLMILECVVLATK